MKSIALMTCLLFVLAMASHAGMGPGQFVRHVPARVDASVDTIYVPGGTLAGAEHAGSLEATINADTTAGGARVNPNRVYALYQGQVYYQRAPIVCVNPSGKLTICGVPSASGAQKPIILIAPVPPAPTVSAANGATVNIVYGSIKCENIHYQAMQRTGSTTNELFMCGTSGTRAQSLEINNCLFEFSNIDLFDCTNETGAIGGWPYGAKFRFTNSYFRNLFSSGQWWGSRVFQCKHPIDTLWVENCTVTTGGLTFLQQNQLTEFLYINHNTIVNNKKYWLLSPYHKSMFITNNMFINQNWVGEDTNVTFYDIFKQFNSTINVDSSYHWNGVIVQQKYYQGDSSHYSSALNLDKLQIYVSDNINYYDPLLINGYYNSGKYRLASIDALPSYLNWTGYGTGPWRIGNVPGEWMNSRTLSFFAAYAPPNGGFIEKRTSTADPGTVTPGIADASVVDSMAVWNQNQWGDPRFPAGAALTSTAYIYGDYNPRTLPGIVGSVKTDTITAGPAGISKFTDLTENFSQSGHLSAIDDLPIGALIWDDAKLAAYNSADDWSLVYGKYLAEGGLPTSVTNRGGLPGAYALSKNYPNPFNPATTIGYSMAKGGNVELIVFNVLGQKVRTLVHENVGAGQHSVRWDGKDALGNVVSSGVYFYRMRTASGFVATQKMVLVK